MKRLFIGVAALCCLAAYAAATVHDIDNFRNPDGTPLIVPKPQQYEVKSGVFRLPETLTVEAPASEKIILEYLSAELKRFSRKVVPGDKSAVCRFILTRGGVPENEEGYALEITPGGITVKARTTAGLFYGAVTLGNLLRNAERPELDCCVITDWPTLPYRCYTLRISNVPPEKLMVLKNLIDAMAKFKLNCVFLEVAEAFPYRSEEFVKAKYHHSREALTDFRDHCRARHVKIVPSLQVLSHNAWMTAHADWNKIKEGEPSRMWESQPCIQNEEARRITMNCLKEQIEFFDPEILYIYTDEIVLGPFRQCPRCRNVPVMTLLADYMKFLRTGLREFKGRLLFSNDSFYSEHNPKWPWGDELRRKYLDPARDIVGYWDYGSSLKENGIAPFKEFATFGTALTGRPLNVRNMTRMIRKYKGEGVRMTHWYYSQGGSFVNFKTETPESIGGFPQGAEYLWNDRDVYYADFTYDGVYEMLRVLMPEKANEIPVREAGTPLPIHNFVNAELSASGLFPVLDDENLAELKKLLAARPERFELLTAPGGRYYGMRISGDPKDGGRQGIRFNAFNRKFKTLSLLMTASRPYNLCDYLATGRYFFRIAPGAKLFFNYADGETRTAPLRYRADFTDWNRPFGGFNMRFAVRGVDARGSYYNFGICDLANPRPDVPVKNIAFCFEYLDGISPSILAASLKGADGPLPAPGNFDPAKIAKPYPTVAPPGSKVKIYCDFESGMPEALRIDPPDKFSVKVESGIVALPGRGKVLKIALRPEGPAEGDIRVHVSVPFAFDGKMKGTFARLRVAAAPGDFSRAREYLHTRKITDSLEVPGKFRGYALRGVGGEWAAVSSSYEGKASESNLRNLEKANTRRLCFFFNRVSAPAEIYIDDLGETPESYDIVPEWGPGRGERY